MQTCSKCQCRKVIDFHIEPDEERAASAEEPVQAQALTMVTAAQPSQQLPSTFAVRVEELKGSIKLSFPASYPQIATLVAMIGAITTRGP